MQEFLCDLSIYAWTWVSKSIKNLDPQELLKNHIFMTQLPVVPRKAAAEVSNIGNLWRGWLL